MDPSRFIAGKLKFEGKLTAGAIAVSYLVIIIAVAVSSGFRHTVREGITDFAGDAVITTVRPSYLSGDESIPGKLSVEDRILSISGVEELIPSALRAGVVKCGDQIHGVMFRGDPAFKDSTLRVTIPSALANLTGLGPGDAMVSYFVGEKVKVRKWTVSEVTDDPVAFDGNLVVNCSLDDLRRVSGWGLDRCGSFRVRFSSGYKTPSAMSDICARISAALMESEDPDEQALMAVSSRQLYPQVYDWLDLLDVNVLFILALMTIVAGFNMVSGLLIMLLRNISVIGTLKTLGMTDRAVGKVFVLSASRSVLWGMLVGNALALCFCVIQGTTHLIKLNPVNYFVSFVPVRVDILRILSADIISGLVIIAILLLPTLLISGVDPARTVRMQ